MSRTGTKAGTVLIAALGLAMQAWAYAQIQSGPQIPPGMDTQPGAVIQPPVEPSADLSSGAPSAMTSEAGVELQATPAKSRELPAPQTQNDVTYLCGGVGVEEADYVKRAAKDYDMMLTFATADGSYLADVDVAITDPKGQYVLQAKCDGPLMLVDLPQSGNYRVRADTAGYSLNKTVKVTAGERKGRHLSTAVLTWPREVATPAGKAAISTGGNTSGSAASGQR